jgi:hypothetical protein
LEFQALLLLEKQLLPLRRKQSHYGLELSRRRLTQDRKAFMPRKLQLVDLDHRYRCLLIINRNH